jgi:alpha-aminoadipate/glutamate carrier protein LysW
MPIAVCPGCDEDIHIPGRPTLGQLVTCEHCGSQFEVISVQPLELDWAFDELEDDEDSDDWDDEEDEDDDY